MRDQVFTRQRRKALLRSAGDRAEGRIAIKHRTRNHAGETARIFQLHGEPIDRALAFTFERVLRVVGTRDDGCQNLASLFHIVDRRGEAEEGALRSRCRTEARAKAFQATSDFAFVHPARTLVGKGSGHFGDPGLRARIADRSARDEHGHGRKRDIAGLRGHHLDAVIERALDDLCSLDHRPLAGSGHGVALAFGSNRKRLAVGRRQGAELRHRDRIGVGRRIVLASRIGNVRAPIFSIIGARDALDVLDSNRCNGCQPLVREAGIAGADQRFAQFEGATAGGFALTQGRSDKFVLCFRKLGSGDRLIHHTLAFGDQYGAHLFGVSLRIGNGELRQHPAFFLEIGEMDRLDRLAGADEGGVHAAVVSA